MAKQVSSTMTLVGRLLRLMKALLPWIALAVTFAVTGFIITVSIPTGLAYLGLLAIKQQPIPIGLLYLLLSLAILRGLARYGEHYFGHFVAFHSLHCFSEYDFQEITSLISGPSRSPR